MEYHCTQCRAVLLRKQFYIENCRHLGKICSEECGFNLFASIAKATNQQDAKAATTWKISRIEGKNPRDEIDPRVLIVEKIKEDDVNAVSDLIRHVTKEDLELQYCKSAEMCRLLIDNGADAFRYIGKGTVAIEECSKYFSIREFMPEATTNIDYDDMHDEISQKRVYMAQNNMEMVPFPAKQYLENYNNAMLVFRFKQLLWNGILPDTSSIDEGLQYEKRMEDIVFRRYNEATFEFWYDTTVSEFIKELALRLPWFLYSLEAARRRGITKADSFALLFVGPTHLNVYKESRRPVNDMSMFRVAGSKTFERVPEGERYKHFFPVTRYASGMHKSLFFGSNDQAQYCGTYYYLEPESSCFLYLKNPLFAKNKVDAYEKLSGSPLPENDSRAGDAELAQKYVGDDLNYTPGQYITAIGQSPGSKKNMALNWNRTFFCGFILGVYALEDGFDQDICELAKDKKHDGIVLEHLVGSRQIVAEVYDTRSRQESLENLHFLEEREPFI